MRQRSTWVVTVTDLDTGDPYTYGPYTKSVAEGIERSLEKFLGAENEHVLVSAYPLHRVSITYLKETWGDKP